MELSSRSRNRLLDAVDYVARNVQAVLEKDVCSTETVDTAAKPEENGNSRALDTFHYLLRPIKDASSYLKSQHHAV